MADQLNTLLTLTQGAEFTAPLSPAVSLDLTTGYDAEGWPVYLTVRVGMRVVTPSGRLYKVIGFTKANTVICVQAGLDIDPAISTVELLADGLEWADKPVLNYQHSAGLVEMAG